MDHFVRAAAYAGFCELVVELGQDPADLLRSVGVDISVLAYPDQRIPFRAFLESLNLAADRTGTPNFGLILSQRQQISTIGAVGMAMKHAPDLGSAMRVMLDFYHLHATGSRVSLTHDGEKAELRFEVILPDPPSLEQQIDLVAGIGLSMFRVMSRRKDPIEGVYLMRRRPADSGLYRQLLGNAIYFNQEFNALRFDRSWLSLPLEDSNSELIRVLLDYLGQQKKSLPIHFIDQVHDAILYRIHRRDVSIETVSQSMMLTPRTLQRRLKHHDTGFKEMLDNVRKDLSKRYLRDSSLSVTEISDILCYSELATFTRFFKRHFKTTPSEWRSSAY